MRRLQSGRAAYGRWRRRRGAAGFSPPRRARPKRRSLPSIALSPSMTGCPGPSSVAARCSRAGRISGRRPAGPDLTHTELRVARLAASGHANKEIAATLFMSVHTVEAHLSHVYRKLGLRSRTELAQHTAISAEAQSK